MGQSMTQQRGSIGGMSKNRHRQELMGTAAGILMETSSTSSKT